MSRWNIQSILFFGVSGQRRDITLVPGEVNIITGASGTGKSTLIRAVDYCLGSSRCELPVHVRRRSVAVGVKWVLGEAELILGRVIPPVGQGTSGQMFATTGRGLALPRTLDEFAGATTVEAAKALIERVFGIADRVYDSTDRAAVRGRATVRHVTPYLFVTKEVIYSESVLLHGLEKVEKARDIIATMPYFLGATDQASAIDEHRLRQLQGALEREEAKARTRAANESALKRRAWSLLSEAQRLGLIGNPPADATEAELMSLLHSVVNTTLSAVTYPAEGEYSLLQQRRQDVLSHLEALRRQARAARRALGDAVGFQSAVHRQLEKLKLAEHLRLDQVSGVCPVCDSPSERGRATAQALRATLDRVRDESVAVERVAPRLLDHDQALERDIAEQTKELNRIEDQIQTWLRQSEDARRLANLEQIRAHLFGRISYFLEASAEEPRQTSRDLTVLRGEVEALEGRVNRDSQKLKLQRAERKVSQYASESFAVLPTVAPCIGSELEFSARVPEVVVIEAGSGAVLRMPDVGSDQNYLAIHIALSFGLQRHFEAVSAPVPGVLLIDQISRPFFPSRAEDEDVDETEVLDTAADEDLQAMGQHVDFLFAETARRRGLQVLLIEHAYFAGDPRYVAATRERWTRASGRALIPLDWPTRGDT